MLVTYAAHYVQHMHKALQQMNLKLANVVSDVTGQTGMAILADEEMPLRQFEGFLKEYERK